MTTTTIAVPRDVPDGYMPIPTAEQIADALENVRCFHDLSAELIAPELLANLLAVTTVKESLSVAHSLPAAGSAVEEVEFVAWRYGFSGGVVRDSAMPDDWRRSGEYEPLMTVAQHERISDRRKALEKRAENMREYLRTNMEKAGISEIKALDGSFTAKLGKGRPSVVIDDEDALPGDSEFVRWTKAPNKTAIADAIKAGQEVPGAHLETKPSLTIK